MELPDLQNRGNTMKVRTDSQGYISDFCFIGDISDSIEITDLAESEQQHFADNFQAYKFVDGVLYFDEEKLSAINAEKEKTTIRRQRESECFPIINRGQLWYATLSPEQLTELSNWYTAWLDAPETLTTPKAPEWLNTVTQTI